MVYNFMSILNCKICNGNCKNIFGVFEKCILCANNSSKKLCVNCKKHQDLHIAHEKQTSPYEMIKELQETVKSLNMKYEFIQKELDKIYYSLDDKDIEIQSLKRDIEHLQTNWSPS